MVSLRQSPHATFILLHSQGLFPRTKDTLDLCGLRICSLHGAFVHELISLLDRLRARPRLQSYSLRRRRKSDTKKTLKKKMIAMSDCYRKNVQVALQLKRSGRWKRGLCFFVKEKLQASSWYLPADLVDFKLRFFVKKKVLHGTSFAWSWVASQRHVFFATEFTKSICFTLPVVNDNEIVRNTSGVVEGKSGLICLVCYTCI